MPRPINNFNNKRLMALKDRFENMAVMIPELMRFEPDAEEGENHAEAIALEQQQVADELARTLKNMGYVESGHLGTYVQDKYYVVEPGMFGPPEFYQMVVGLKGRYEFACPHCNKDIALLVDRLKTHGCHACGAFSYVCVGCKGVMTLALEANVMSVHIKREWEAPPQRRLEAEDLCGSGTESKMKLIVNHKDGRQSPPSGLKE